uniref:Protein kinase domain-containing protein n=1 Tax=Oryza punctata TaxID=4537 RepID=A0A0E0MMI6_ORYPU
MASSSSDLAAVIDDEVTVMTTEYVHADEFDMSTIHLALEEKLAGAAKRGGGKEKVDEGAGAPKAAWEIDLSRLCIRSVVAQGHHGTLFRADYGGHDVAVKVLDWGEDGYSTPEQIAHLRASLADLAAVWYAFEHPNVARFFGASMGTTDLNIPVTTPSSSAAATGGEQRNTGKKPPPDRACCVVVEFLGGGTLKKHLIDHYRSKLPYGEVVRLALSMARGLSFLHANKIVHRDVKTENMLLLAGAGDPDLKIADFGVARVEAGDPREMTGATGTVGYMAPEVIDGKPYNHKCDVYSFGICLWEMYCCEMPFTFGLSIAEASAAVVQRGMRPVIPPCCPPCMAAIMARCWDADPAARPEMEEVVRLLEALDTSNGGGMLAPGMKKKKTKKEEEKMPGCFCFFGRS